MATAVRRKPWIHTWTDEDGIQRQAKIHYTRDDRTVVWSPRYLGDEEPWFDGDYELSNPAAYFGDEELVTLGDPNDPWFGLIDPDEDEEFD
ncbi:hypothetical protein [Streptomyces sp. NPDC057002]|uniref:hypothetical protein n=1 Tax=Streptomyces sp. NPDC057002 TaxID=3345992 RepID=UPI0036355852